MSEPRIVIVDGPDRVGKTHIAWALSQRLGIPYFKSGMQRILMREHGDFKAELEHGESRQLELIQQLGLSMVQDRGYPAEWVYSRVYSRPTNSDMLRAVDDFYARLGTTVIVPLLRDYSDAPPDDLVEPRALPLIHDGYGRFLEMTRCRPVVLYVDDLGRDLEREMDYIAGCTGWKVST